MAFPFLTARWSNLFLATYAVPPAVLERRLPPGLSLDLRDGQAFVSLVAFDFLDTRVLGVPWPGYRNFPELNLRFYVRQGSDRGVVFVREFVPQRLVAWLARVLYNEPYVAVPITSHMSDEPTRLGMEFRLQYGGRTHTLRVTGNKPPQLPPEDSIEHFFKEHRWGFGVTRAGKAVRYEVAHPLWNIYPVQSYQLDVDWKLLYGSEWASMQDATPCSTILAVGSPVAVYGKGKLAHSVGDHQTSPALALRASSG